jgi:hypothetical protein
MSGAKGITGIGAQLAGATLSRFIPEPKSSKSLGFGGFMSSVGSAISSVAGKAIGIDPGYAGLIEKQIEVQTQMQLVSMQSNIEKSKHETEMAAIRNIRAG